MSAPVETPASAPRKRDSAATRQALLAAARELFGSQGFEQTTLRDIGERAGADPSLIARYFGNKVALYLAAIAADEPLFDEREPPSMERMVRRALARSDNVGPGPLIRATIRPDQDEEIKAATRAHWTTRVLDPLSDRLRDGGVEDPELRAELIAAMMIGAIVVRAGDVFPALSTETNDFLADELAQLLDRLLAP